jgi:hypothetical protein
MIKWHDMDTFKAASSITLSDGMISLGIRGFSGNQQQLFEPNWSNLKGSSPFRKLYDGCQYLWVVRVVQWKD